MSALEVQVGRHLREHRDELALAVLEQFLARHPAPVDRNTPEAARCVDALRNHLDLLGQAIAVGQVVLWEDYLDWARDVARLRGVGADCVRNGFEVVDEVLRNVMTAAHYDLARPFMDAGRRVLAPAPEAAPAACPRAGPAPAPATGPGPAGAPAERAAPWAGLPAALVAEALLPRGLARDYLDKLLAGRRREAHDLIMRARWAGTGLAALFVDVFQPALVQLGRLWQAGAINVGQEHYCTAVTQGLIARLWAEAAPHLADLPRAADPPWDDPAPGAAHVPARGAPAPAAPLAAAAPAAVAAGATPGPRAPDAPAHRHTFVGVCVSAERHDVGLRMVADLLELRGWASYYLGADMPDEAVVTEVVARKADVLGISATMAVHLDAVARLVRAVRHDPRCAAVKVLVGGRPFNLAPGLAQRLGADAAARDARDALAAADELVAIPPPQI